MTAVSRGMDSLPELVDDLDPKSILLVRGGSSYEQSGADDVVRVVTAHRETGSITGVTPNPTLEDVSAGIAEFRALDPDVVLAIGGGSVIDLAKSIRALAPQAADARSIIESGSNGIETEPVPLIAVPTTAGTGSEVTHFSVVYIDGIKHSLAHRWVRPTHAILDPELTASVPPAITAATGLDALAQAVESLWSVRSTPESAAFAKESIELALTHLADAVHDPTTEAREAMLQAAHMAGRGIDITTTTAPHALSYAITSGFGVPHGHAVALSLGAVLVHNAGVTEDDCNDPRGADHVRTRVAWVVGALGATTPESAADRWRDLVESLGLSMSLADLGAHSRASRRAIADAVNPQRLANNPRNFTADDLTSLVESLA